MKSFTKISFFFLVLTQISFAQNGWFQQTSGTTDSLTGVSFIDANNGWVVGFNGTILRTTDGGANWISQESGINDDLYRVSFTDANNGTAVGDSGIILRTINGGVNWVSQVSGTTNELLGISFTDANNGTAVGLGGTILRTTDGGETWVSQNSQRSGITNDLFGVSFTDVNNGTAVGDSGIILRTTNGGVNWVSQVSGTTNRLLGVSFTDANNGTAVGDFGIILRTTDGGVNWVSQTSGIINVLYLFGVSFTDANNGTVVGDSGIILRTTNGGESWVSQISGTSNWLLGVSFTNANNGTAVGEVGTILRTTVLTVDPPNQNVPYSAGNTTFTVTSNTAWSVSDDANWLTVSPSEGSGNDILTATYTENTTTIQRVGTITVSGGGITDTVTVTQAPGPAVLTVTPPNQDVSHQAGDTTFVVTSNVSWVVNDDANWLTVSPPEGSGNGVLTATYTENTTTSQRTGTITVTDGSITQQVTVTQSAGPAVLTVAPSNQDVIYRAGDTTFTVTSNVSWVVSDDADWLTVSPPEGSGNGVLTATFTENTTTAQRVGTITVTDGGIIQQVTVTQSAGPAVLTVTPQNRDVSYQAGDTTFTVTSNISWSVSDDADWLTVSPPEGLGNDTLTATYTVNTTTVQRVGTITVTDGVIIQQVTVTQAAGPAVLTVTPSNQDVSYQAGDTTFTITSNVSWTVSDDADWLTVSPPEGAGNDTITAIYTENTTTNQRTGTITVTGGGIIDTFTVTQAPGPSVLTVTPPNQSVAKDSGNTTFAVTSNVSWTVSDDADWLTVNPPEGSGNGVLTATFTENTTTNQRTGRIIVIGGGITDTVTVTQSAGSAILTVTPPNQNVSYQAGDTTFTITSNVSWIVSDDADWLMVSPPEGAGNDILTATYTENTTTNQRVGTITVTGGGITDTVTVTQSAVSAILTVTPLNQDVSYQAGDITFDVTSNVSWTVSDDADWLMVSPPEGSGNDILTATYTENTTTTQKTGTVTVTGGEITQQVIVMQAGTPALHAVPNSLFWGDVIAGTNSASRSYNLTGSNLLSDVTIIAPSGFTLSTSQLGFYTDTITVPWSGDTINTMIWVKFSPTQVQQYTGNITNTSTGVVVDIPVEGVGIFYPSQFPVNVSYSFPNFSTNKNYQIIGLPGENDFSLKNIMPENPYDWRAFWEPGTGDYIEYDGTDLFNFRPGRAFWIISRYQINISDTFNTVSLAMDNSYSISLHNEWNLISNPFDKNIFWQDVKNANPGLDEPIYYFHSGDYDSSEVFEKYKGYYFYNNPSLEMESLKIPYIPFDNSIPKTNNNVYARNELEILLSEKDIAISSLILGYTENANPGVDSFDKFSPPAGFSEINFAIYNKELETNYKYLRKDMRPAIGEGQEYDLVVKNTSDKNLVFTTQGLENFENYLVYILDKNTMQLYDLRKQNSFEVKKNTSEKHYSLFIGTEEYINEKEKSLIPAEYTLYQNYPNPFNPSTTIMYALPKQSKVSLNVYNVLGELVSVLINNELQEAGYHQEIFKGNLLSSGVYIYKLVAGDYTNTKKMLIIK